MSYFSFLKNKTEPNVQKDYLKQAPYYILLAFIFFLPILIIPSAVLSFQFTKVSLTIATTLLASILFILSILKIGQIKYPSHRSLWLIPLVPIVYLLASIFSPVPSQSLFGYGQEITTFGFILILFSLLALISLQFLSRERVLYAYLAFLGAFIFLALFHLLRLIFGVDFLSLGLFNTLSANTVGQWSDLAIFFGLGGILALITLEELKLNFRLKIVFQIILLSALLFLAVINFTIIWYVLAGLALFYFVLALTSKSEEKEQSNLNSVRKISINALVVLLVSVTFIIGGQTLGGFISGQLNVVNMDVRLSWTGTAGIVEGTLRESPLLGSGPNRFVNQWLQFKPEGINQSAFWNSDFSYAVGMIPTFLITTGLLGILTWLAFLALLGFWGFKVMFKTYQDPIIRYLVISSFLTTVFLWIMNIVYVPGVVIFILTFVFTGLFVASLVLAEAIPLRQRNIYYNSKVGFINALALVLILILIVALGYAFGQRTLASIYFQQSNRSLMAGDLILAERQLSQAITLAANDTFYRSLSQLHIARATQIVQERQTEQLTEEEVINFSQYLQRAVSAAQMAINENNYNYRNWLNLGQIYQQGVLFGITDAYDLAQEAYLLAREHNPTSPALILQMARLEIAGGEYSRAREYINQAREMRGNYPEAIFLLARLEASQGNVSEAIVKTQEAIQLTPRDGGLYFELGLLYYNDSQFEQAITSFSRAIDLVPQYANAKYFLGLSLSRHGQTAEAMELFEELSNLAPESQEVRQILNNLRSGEDPLAGLDISDIGDDLSPEESLPLEDDLEEGEVIDLDEDSEED